MAAGLFAGVGPCSWESGLGPSEQSAGSVDERTPIDTRHKQSSRHDPVLGFENSYDHVEGTEQVAATSLRTHRPFECEFGRGPNAKIATGNTARLRKFAALPLDTRGEETPFQLGDKRFHYGLSIEPA